MANAAKTLMPLVAVAGLGALAIFTLGGTKKVSAGPADEFDLAEIDPEMYEAYQEAIAGRMAPEEMRVLASHLRGEYGLNAEANTLEDFANYLESGAALPPPPPGVIPPAPPAEGSVPNLLQRYSEAVAGYYTADQMLALTEELAAAGLEDEAAHVAFNAAYVAAGQIPPPYEAGAVAQPGAAAPPPPTAPPAVPPQGAPSF